MVRRRVTDRGGDHSGGVISGGTMTRTRRATGAALLAPSRKRRSQVRPITTTTGKGAEGERVAEGPAVATKGSNVPGATLQPITALSQRVQVPPQQGSRQLRSDTRLRRGVTCGGASSGVKVSATSKGVGLVERRATLRAGAQAKAGDASKWDTCQEARDRTTREPSPTLLGEGEDGGEGAGPAHPSFPPAYRHWHAEKGE